MESWSYAEDTSAGIAFSPIDKVVYILDVRNPDTLYTFDLTTTPPRQLAQHTHPVLSQVTDVNWDKGRNLPTFLLADEAGLHIVSRASDPAFLLPAAVLQEIGMSPDPQLFRRVFENNNAAIAISPDGTYMAVWDLTETLDVFACQP